MTGGGVRCPVCGSIDWYRDGIVCHERRDGRIGVERVEAARAPRDDWSCMTCGYEVLHWSGVRRLLDGLAADAGPLTEPGPEPRRPHSADGRAIA